MRTRLIALVLMLALVAAACGGGSDSDSVDASKDDKKNEQGDGKGGDDPELTGDADGDGVADHNDPIAALGKALTSEQGGSGGAVGSEENLPPLERFGAPQPGRYEYRLGDDDDDGRNRIIDVFDREREFQPDEGFGQLHLRYGHDDGFLLVVYWNEDGMTVTDEIKFRSDGTSRHCRWDPPYLSISSDLSVGSKWSYESVCVNPDQPKSDFVITRTAVHEVTEQRTVKFFGRSFEVATFNQEFHEKAVGPISVSDDRFLTYDWSLPFGMPVRVRGTVGSATDGEINGFAGSMERIESNPAKPGRTDKPVDLHG